MWQTSDQVNADVANAAEAKTSNVRQCRRARVQATDGGTLPIDERLNSQADPVHATPAEGFENFGGERSGSALHRDFCSGCHVEFVPHRLKQALQLVGSE